MRWFKVLDRPDYSWVSFDADHVNFCGFDPGRLYSGEWIEDWPGNIRFLSSDEDDWERADDCLFNVYMHLPTLNAYMFPVYSSRFQEALLAARIEDFQFLPCGVEDRKGKKLSGYAVANVLTFRDALDPTRTKAIYQDSELKPKPNVLHNIKAMLKPAFIGCRLDGCNAFRLPEDPRNLYVSEKFRKAYKSIRGTGITFTECLVH